jgi:hypothetical protein
MSKPLPKKSLYKTGILFFWIMAAIMFLMTASTKIYRLKSLKNKLHDFEKNLSVLNEKKTELSNVIKAIDDPVWLELALMEELGVIPEGALKINYIEEE